MNALTWGCWVPDMDRGPLHSTSADFTSIFRASANRGTEIVQPVMIPFPSRCHADVEVPGDTLRLKLL